MSRRRGSSASVAGSGHKRGRDAELAMLEVDEESQPSAAVHSGEAQVGVARTRPLSPAPTGQARSRAQFWRVAFLFVSAPLTCRVQQRAGDASEDDDDAKPGVGTADEGVKLFLQAFLGSGSLSAASLAGLVQRLNGRCDTAGKTMQVCCCSSVRMCPVVCPVAHWLCIQSYIDEANRRLREADLFMGLKRCGACPSHTHARAHNISLTHALFYAISAQTETAGVEHWVLCNLKDTDQGVKSFGVSFAKADLQYFERVLARIAGSRHGVAQMSAERGTGLLEKTAMLRAPMTPGRAMEVSNAGSGQCDADTGAVDRAVDHTALAGGVW